MGGGCGEKTSARLTSQTQTQRQRVRGAKQGRSELKRMNVSDREIICLLVDIVELECVLMQIMHERGLFGKVDIFRGGSEFVWHWFVVHFHPPFLDPLAGRLQRLPSSCSKSTAQRGLLLLSLNEAGVSSTFRWFRLCGDWLLHTQECQQRQAYRERGKGVKVKTLSFCLLLLGLVGLLGGGLVMHF